MAKAKAIKPNVDKVKEAAGKLIQNIYDRGLKNQVGQQALNDLEDALG